MLQPRLRASLFLSLRIVLTMVAWVVFIAYAHHLSHVYLGGIKTALGSTTAQVIVQAAILSGLIYFIMLSLPFLPTLNFRKLCVLVLWSLILVVGHQLSHEGFHQLRANLVEASGGIGLYGLLLGTFLYVFVLALPFIPGVEFGLLLMVLFGREGVVAAYVATVVGLSLAYFAAQALPGRITLGWMNRLGLSDAAGDPREAMDALVPGRGAGRGVAARLGGFLLSHRYLALAVSLNLPGNSVIGGGGGIAALCGLTRQFNGWRYVLTLGLATAPLPLVVLFGLVEIEPLLERHGILHDILSRAASVFLHE